MINQFHIFPLFYDKISLSLRTLFQFIHCNHGTVLVTDSMCQKIDTCCDEIDRNIIFV